MTLQKDKVIKWVRFTPPQVLAIGFFLTIIIGAVLLMLPISTTKPLSWIDALFTAASATTVTGLAVVDTGTQFTVFGQTVIMGLIQIGGLGFMTFAVLIVMILGKNRLKRTNARPGSLKPADNRRCHWPCQSPVSVFDQY